MPAQGALGSILSSIPSLPRAAAPPGGAVPPTPGGPSPEASGPFGAAISKQLSETNGADPEYIHEVIKNMTMQISSMIPKVALRFGDIDKHLVTAYRSLQSALAAADKAKNSAAAMKPIDFSAATAGASMAPPQSTAIPGLGA